MRGKPKNPEVQAAIKRCNELGIAYETYLSRLKKGWSKEKALNTPQIRAKYFTKDGVSVFKYLRSIGKNYNKFSQMLINGYSPEEALLIVEKSLNKKQRYELKLGVRK